MKWPSIPTIDEVNLGLFTAPGTSLVFTEKLDGLNVRLSRGKAYIRDNSGEPHDAPYMALVKKWHAPKTSACGPIQFYGEDLYARHSCEYAPVRESETFRVFAATTTAPHEIYPSPMVMSFDMTIQFAWQHKLTMAPMLGLDYCASEEELREYVAKLMELDSVLGGEQEGIVVRIAGAFGLRHVPECMFKVVRPGHVQPDAEHWRKNWKPREIVWEQGNP